MRSVDAGDDALRHSPDSSAERWFDRCYFNICSPAGDLFLVAGMGVYPNAKVIDGYVCLVAGGRQRNFRMSTQGAAGDSSLPIAIELIEPLEEWHLGFVEPELGINLDAVWQAAFPPHIADAISIEGGEGTPTHFEHFYQLGSYGGALTVDGHRHDLTGWLGHRDRSWGLRGVQDRLGMHMWLGAGFDGGMVAVHYNEDRNGRVAYCDGIVDLIEGRRRLVTAVNHNLYLDSGDELVGGTLELRLDDRSMVNVEVTPSGRGVYMDGAGYGGWHGVRRGIDHVEHEVWSLDSMSPRTLGSALVDKLCSFKVDGRDGRGVFELAVSRSSSFNYRPSAQENR
jgi:hypothetical protein